MRRVRNHMSAALMVRIAEVLGVNVQYFFEELPTGAKNTKEIKTPVLTEMSLSAHGPRLIDAFLNLTTDKRRDRRSRAGARTSRLTFWTGKVALSARLARATPQAIWGSSRANERAVLAIVGLSYATSRASICRVQEKATRHACPIPELILALPQRFEYGHPSTINELALRSERVPT
jgi:hypothetical protein